jgi:HEAT repeat protein
LQAIGTATNPRLESNELVRLRATEALWEAGKKDLLDPVPILKRSLADPSQRLRLAAVLMLRKLGTPATIDVLASAALDKGQGQTIRLKAIEALGAVALSDLGPVGRQIATANISIFTHRGVDPVVPRQALIGWHERQIGYLSSIATDPSNGPTLMLRAVKSIGQIKDKSAIPTLQRIIAARPHPSVTKHATRVLSHVMARQYE